MRKTYLLLAAVAVVPATAHAGGQLFDRVVGALNPQPCGAANGCWTNHLRVTDIDGDDDLDVIFANYADFFGGNNAAQPLAVYRNNGGTLSDASFGAVGDIDSNAHQICIGDVDGDGSGDIYVPDGPGVLHRLMMNDGTGVYVDEGDIRLPTDVPNGGACRFGDMDADGDLDLIVSDGYGGGGGAVLLWINDGNGVFTDVPGAFPGPLSGSDIDDIEVFDADRDFDLDVFANAHTGGHGAYFLNDGAGTFTNESFPPPASGNFHYNAAICDVDNDGDLDMWIDNIGGGFTEQLLINDGAGVFSDVTAAQVSGNQGADDNGVVCVDIDNDGDMDGVVLSLATPERHLDNDGTGNFTFVAGTFPGPTDCTLWGEFGDLDDDGRIDLVTGQGECGSSNEVYLANTGLAVDDRAPVIIAVEQGGWGDGDDPIVRYAVSDRTVTDEGPQLARAFVVVDPGGADTIIDAVFVGGDLFRAELPTVDAEGYVFQACAEDRAGNLGCSDSIDVGEVAGTGGTDSGDSGGPDTGVDPDDTAGDVADAPDDGPGDAPDDGPGDDDAAGTAGSGDSTGADGGGSDGGGDCACRNTDRAPSSAWLFACGLLLLRRRKGA